MARCRTVDADGIVAILQIGGLGREEHVRPARALVRRHLRRNALARLLVAQIVARHQATALLLLSDDGHPHLVAALVPPSLEQHSGLKDDDGRAVSRGRHGTSRRAPEHARPQYAAEPAPRRY